MMENSGRACIVQVKRVETFNAAHRLHSKHLSDQENIELYGKCNNVNGHGHNYKVEVTLQGPVNPTNGMVANLSELKIVMQQVLDELDHKNLDLDIAYFRDIVSTAENIAVYIWDKLMQTEMLGGKKLLYKVKVWETDKNMASYKGLRL